MDEDIVFASGILFSWCICFIFGFSSGAIWKAKKLRKDIEYADKLKKALIDFREHIGIALFDKIKLEKRN